MNETASYDAVIKALRMLKKIRRLEGTVLIHEGVLLSADTLLHESQNEGFVREVNALTSLYRNSDNELSRVLLGFDGGNVMLFHAAPFTLALLFGDLENAKVVERAGEDFLRQWSSSLKIDSAALAELPDLSPDQLEEAPPETSDSLEERDERDEDTLPIAPILPGLTSTEESENPNGSDIPKPTEEAHEIPLETVTPAEEPAPEPSMDISPEKRWNAYREKVETLFSKVLGRAQASRLVERELTAMGVSEGGYLTTSQFRPFGQKLIKKVKDRTVRKQLEIELVSIVETFVD
ncbi:MAG: hypothetical protein AAF733_11445 [Verrucomicrobiota bacterium]